MKYLKKIFEEAAPRIPRLDAKGKEYWKRKGKKGSDVMIYLHDDMDGIYSAIMVKSRLLDLGYNIVGYGILNYMDGWKKTTIHPEYINVAVDFANMPKSEKKDAIDIYIDHHGVFTEEEKKFYQQNPVVKTKTGSAYEGICVIIGKPIDAITLYSIDMIDSAKYDDYNVDWKDILNFSWERFKEIAEQKGGVTIHPFKESQPVKLSWAIIAKLTFAGAFNQLLKRSDYKTIIEVIDNVKDPGIYGIYNAMKKIYPGNNIWTSGYSAGSEKDFINDSKLRLQTMQQRTRGQSEKPIFKDQKEFVDITNVKPSGYQIIGNLMYVPSGTWSNALRARSILMSEYDDGIIPKDHKVNYILLQYGNTLQVCSVEKMDKLEEYIKLPDGYEIKDLGDYMSRVLSKFQKYFGYYEPKTEIGQEELTTSGGHVGIGTISNIVGRVNKVKILNKRPPEATKKLVEKYDNFKYLDLFKNKIISDLSGIGDKKWPVGLVWNDEDNDNKGQIIRDIINNDPKIKERIEKFVEENIGDKEDAKKKKNLEKEIKNQIRDELKELSDDELEIIHNKVMMDYKVMMKPDVRQISNRGKITSSANWSTIKSFDEFKK